MNSFGFTYGFVEARVKLSKGDWFWPCNDWAGCQKAPTSQAPVTQGPEIFGRHKAHEQNIQVSKGPKIAK